MNVGDVCLPPFPSKKINKFKFFYVYLNFQTFYLVFTNFEALGAEFRKIYGIAFGYIYKFCCSCNSMFFTYKCRY